MCGDVQGHVRAYLCILLRCVATQDCDTTQAAGHGCATQKSLVCRDTCSTPCEIVADACSIPGSWVEKHAAPTIRINEERVTQSLVKYGRYMQNP